MDGESARAGWWVYLLTCADGSIYVGATTEVERRLREHNAGKGARYTRLHRPVSLAGAVACVDQSEALRLEARLKRRSHAAKVRYALAQAAATPGPRA